MKVDKGHATDKLVPKQVAEALGVCVATLCHWRQKSIGPRWHQRETRRVYYLRDDIEAWERRLARGPNGSPE